MVASGAASVLQQKSVDGVANDEEPGERRASVGFWVKAPCAQGVRVIREPTASKSSLYAGMRQPLQKRND